MVWARAKTRGKARVLSGRTVASEEDLSTAYHQNTKTQKRSILLCLATSVRLMGIRLYSWNSANLTNMPARDSMSYSKRQLPSTNISTPYIVTTRILQRFGHVK